MSNIQIKTSVDDFGRGTARWYQSENPGCAAIHFMSANGLPVATYDFFLRRLAESYEITAMDSRGAWPGVGKPIRGYDFREHTKDFLAFGDAQLHRPVHGIGHSMGAVVSAAAALQRPHMFKSLVLVDPAAASQSNRLLRALGPLGRLLLSRKRMIASTAARRRNWPSREDFLDDIRTKRTYRDFTEEAFHDYATGGLQSASDGSVELVYSPAWEAANFCYNTDLWAILDKVRIPTLVIRAENTFMYSRERFNQLQRRYARRDDSAVEFLQLPGLGHLAIQEGPAQVEAAVRSWIERMEAESV